jgi:DNA invertase Pin-like site-specific DNA recombinase
MTRRLAVVPDSPTRAVLYLRQSVSREDSISLELQENAGREHCLRLGYQVVGVEADPGISGRTWERPAVKRVMGLVEGGHADVVVVWKWSRLSRSRRDWAVAVDRIESIGGRLESATEPVDTATATGRFTRGMLAEMAAFESDRIGEVWKEVHDRRRRLGLPSSGGDRFGYARGSDGRYTIDPVTGPLLAEAYRRVIAGHSLRAVTAWLNANGARTLSGGEFTRDRVVKVLDSGFGAGLLVRMGRRGGRVDRSLEGRSWVRAAHDQVITEDEWSAYLASRRSRQPEKGQTGRHLLTGLLTCGDCGAPMWSDRMGRTAGYAWICSRWKEHGDVRCVSIAQHRAEEQVLLWLATEGVRIDAEAPRHLDTSALPGGDEAGGLAQALAKLEAQSSRLLKLLLDERITDAEFDSSQRDLRDRQTAIRRRLDELALARHQAASGSRQRITSSMLRAWPLLPVEERQVILRAVLPTVRVMPPAKRGQRAMLAFGGS